MLTITDPRVPDRNKKSIVLSAGDHPGETASLWGMEGSMIFPVREPGSQNLRKKAIFYAVQSSQWTGLHSALIAGKRRASIFISTIKNSNHAKHGTCGNRKALTTVFMAGLPLVAPGDGRGFVWPTPKVVVPTSMRK